MDEARCIACGTCIRECPQKAKTFRNDVAAAQKLLSGGGKIAVSVAPSFATVFNDWQSKRLPSALRKLGFTYIGHTSQGAYHVSCATLAVLKDRSDGSTKIASACSAVVNYIEKYRPRLIGNILPLVSPMIAHAKIIKHKLGGDTRIVFVGPCVAKKTEIEAPANAGLVDVVLTFQELKELLRNNSVDLANCDESDFDEQPAGAAQLFPLSGGMLKTAGLDTDFLNLDVLAVTGFDNFVQSADLAQEAHGAGCLVEPLLCPEGCINGPGIGIEKNVFDRKRDIIEYSRKNQKVVPGEQYDAGFFKTEFRDLSGFEKNDITEEQINKVLEQTGKSDPKQQLNCGACGYSSCRAKAIAVIQGMAEPEICIPHMRRLAELRGDRILEKSPNGILILDEQLNIISMNPAFMKFFVCSNAILGRNISYLMDPAPFERLAEGKVDNLEMTLSFASYNLVCHGLFYALREERQFVGIFVDITNLKANEQKLEQIKLQTITQARELLEHQMKTAQSIAKFLGETTARGEELIEKLMSLNENDGPQKK